MLGNNSIKDCADYLSKYEKADTFTKNVTATLYVFHAITTLADSVKSVKDFLKKDKKNK